MGQFLATAKGTSASARLDSLCGSDQKSTTAEVASVVETKIFKNSDLLLRCMQGDAIGPGNGDARKVAGADTDDVLSAFTGDDVQVHLSWGPSYCSLTTKLGSRCCG
tara:strand:+ start:932 stop:1252 length:321 start_codon:yes stop_codon:yes gene_type:complete